MRLIAPLFLGAAIGLAGCAYYNALYNANRLVEDAERAEREGRPDEARSLWAQAAMKAESVAVRFPESTHRDDALLVQGRALSELDQCSRAVAPLRTAADSSAEAELRSRARLLLAECWIALGAADSVIDILTPEVMGTDARQRSEALRLRGRAFLQLGEFDHAIADLSAVDSPRNDLALALAHIGLGELEQAVELMERRTGDPLDVQIWQAVLDSLGARDATRAARVVDRLVAAGGLTPGHRARLLRADGERWLAQGWNKIALRRFEAAYRAAPDSLAGRVALGRAAVVETRHLSNLDRVPQLAADLEAAAAGGGAGGEIAQAADMMGRILPLIQGNGDRTTAGDLRLFLLAEAVRDSLQAPALAAALFRFVQQDYPASPVAPKALLAAATLDSAAADSLVRFVFEMYPTSPYVRALRGDAPPTFVAVEDSLRLLGSDVTAAPSPAPPVFQAQRDDLPRDEVIRHGRRPRKP